MSHNNNDRDIALKAVIVTLLAAVIIVLSYNILTGGRTGFIFNLYLGQGLDISTLVASVLVIAVKLLWFVFIVSLIIGLVLVVKKHLLDEKQFKLNQAGKVSEHGYACPCCGTRLTAEFKFCPNCKASLKEICTKCGKELQVGWKCCPLCGAEKTK